MPSEIATAGTLSTKATKALETMRARIQKALVPSLSLCTSCRIASARPESGTR